MVELAVKRGADVFVRDRKGRRILEGDKGADERIKVFLRQCQFRTASPLFSLHGEGFGSHLADDLAQQSIIRRTQCDREMMDGHRIFEGS